jgi:hypothetical protein
MCKWCRCTHKLNKRPKGIYLKFLSASATFTHAWTPEKNRLILIILKFNIVDKNVLFLHIPGLKIAQIKIPWNVVNDFGTLTAWRHMKTSSLKRNDQASFGFVYASILIKFN